MDDIHHVLTILLNTKGKVPRTGPGPFFDKYCKWVDGWKKGGAMCTTPSPKDQYPTWMGNYKPLHVQCHLRYMYT